MAIPGYLPQQASIKAYYALENVNDGSVNAYNLTNNNAVTFTNAKFFSGANFGAVNSNKSLTVTTDFGLASAGAVTYSCWIKLLAEIDTGRWTFVSHTTSATTAYYSITYDYNAGTIRLEFARVKGGVASQAYQHNITLGTTNFYHLALVYDSTNVNGYINGVYVGQAAASGTGDARDPYFSIGKVIGYSEFASALIDEVVVWFTALTATEIIKVFQGSARGGFSGGQPWIFMKEMWEKHNKLWTPKLILPKEGFSY